MSHKERFLVHKGSTATLVHINHATQSPILHLMSVWQTSMMAISILQPLLLEHLVCPVSMVCKESSKKKVIKMNNEVSNESSLEKNIYFINCLPQVSSFVRLFVWSVSRLRWHASGRRKGHAGFLKCSGLC